MDSFPDLATLTDDGLKNLIKELKTEEMEIEHLDVVPESELAYKLDVLHGKLEIVRAELVDRLRDQNEGGDDPGDAGSSEVREPRRPDAGVPQLVGI